MASAVNREVMNMVMREFESRGVVELFLRSRG